MLTLRKKRIPVFLCCMLVVLIPVQSDASLGLSLDILSIGPLSLGIEIPLTGGVLGLLGLVAGVFICFFGGGSRSAAYAGVHQPVITHIKVTVKPDDHYAGDPLRIKFNDVIKDDQLALPGKGYLQVNDDGKMIFRGTDFEGYAYLHYNRTLTVWDQEDNPMVVLAMNGDNLLVIQEKSERAAHVVRLLFGGEK